MAAPQRQWRNYLPNWARAHARGAIEALPARVQQYLPAHDLRRTIRAHPEDRDALDPGWRERAGGQAPTPEDIQSRTQYIELETALAHTANSWQGPRIQAQRANQIGQLAAAIYDTVIEGPISFSDLYTGINPDDSNNILLFGAMTNRMISARLHHTNLAPLFPQNAIPDPQAVGNRRQDYAAVAQVANWSWFPENGFPIPFGLTEELFRLIGRVRHEENPIITDQIYENLIALPDVVVEGDDPIDFEPFEHLDQLLIVRIDGHDYIYKRASLQAWLNARREAGESWTNPSTGLEITIDNLHRATARVLGAGDAGVAGAQGVAFAAAAAGGRRRRRLNTRRRRAGRGAHRSSRRAHR